MSEAYNCAASSPERGTGPLPHAISNGRFRRVLVCGGRKYDDRGAVWAWLDGFHYAAPHDCMVVIQGGAPGADRLARDWCSERFVKYENYPAEWDVHGRSAGPRRNARMLAEGRPDVVVAFPGGVGTADMIRRAQAAGVPVAFAGGVKPSPAADEGLSDSHEQVVEQQRSEPISSPSDAQSVRPDGGE